MKRIVGGLAARNRIVVEYLAGDASVGHGEEIQNSLSDGVDEIGTDHVLHAITREIVWGTDGCAAIGRSGRQGVSSDLIEMYDP